MFLTYRATSPLSFSTNLWFTALAEWQRLYECPVSLEQSRSVNFLNKICVEANGLPLIKTNVVLKNSSVKLPLTFRPSLNYLIVVGGGNNSTRQDYLNEYEFQNNALNHLWWWISADDDQYAKFGLIQNSREIFLTAFKQLMQSHLIDQIFNTHDKNRASSALAKRNADFLFTELNKSGSLLLHANDRTHAFYIQLEALKVNGMVQYNLHVYNTGKGIGWHHQEKVRVNDEIKTKYHTRKSFFDIDFSEEKLQKIIANMDCQAKIPWRISRSIFILYGLFSRWQKSNACQQSLLLPPVLQAKQKYRDCQNESLLAVLRHTLPLKVYKIFKLTLLQRTWFLSIPPAELAYHSKSIQWYYQYLYQRAVRRLEAKIARTHLCIENLNNG